MIWIGWRRCLLAALAVVTLSSGLDTVPSGRAVAAGLPPLHRHSSAARVGLIEQALPAGLAPVVQRALRRTERAAGTGPALWSPQATITATNGAAFDNFAISVALSGDTALIGAYSAHRGKGAAYVFVRSGSTWRQTQELTARGGAAGDQFGQSVALSGTTALIGAPNWQSQMGAAYVFTRISGRWTQQTVLSATDGAGFDFFGQALALDGNSALIGAPGHNSLAGAVYVFVRSGTSWTQTQELTAHDTTTGDQFGFAIGVHGSTALIGAPYKNSQTGAAYVFVDNGGTWTEQAALSGPGTANGAFGFAVAVYGNTALVGENLQYNLLSAVEVFVRSGATWSTQATLPSPTGARGDLFGQAVALGPNIALIGAPNQPPSAGAAYIYVRNGTAWSKQAMLAAPSGATSDLFGVALALRGATALIGAPGTNNFTGAAYVFVHS